MKMKRMQQSEKLIGAGIAPEGTQFIPRGENGTFDSHTLYTAWTGDSGAMIDPNDADTTLFYYVSSAPVSWTTGSQYCCILICVMYAPSGAIVKISLWCSNVSVLYDPGRAG